MITHTAKEDPTDSATFNFPVIRNLFGFYNVFRARQWEQAKIKSDQLAERKARAAVEKSNKKFEKVEEMKYYLTQRHRAAIAALHATPKGKLIDKQFFATMDALTAIEKSNQTVEQKLEHQRIALIHGKREIKFIIADRSRLED